MHTVALVEALKRALKGRGITFATLAASRQLSAALEGRPRKCDSDARPPRAAQSLEERPAEALRPTLQ